jgi:hypothetical protein
MSSAEHRKFIKTDWVDTPANASCVGSTVVSGALATLEKKSLLIGGYNPRTGRCLSQALEFDPATKQWAFLSSSWFSAQVSEACMVAAAGSYVLFGGFNGSEVVDDLWVLTPKSEDLLQTPWILLKKPHGPCARRGHSMVAGGSSSDGSVTVYMHGGFDGSDRLGDLWTLKVSPGGVIGEWQEVRAGGTAPSPRDAAALAYDAQSNRLMLFGGFASTRKNDLFFFDCHESKWHPQLLAGGPSRRQNAFAIVASGYLVIVMGHDGKVALTQVCQLNLSDLKWSLTSFEGEGEMDPRWYGSAGPAEQGKKLIIFGGSNGKAYVNSTLELEFDKVEVVAAKAKGK